MRHGCSEPFAFPYHNTPAAPPLFLIQKEARRENFTYNDANQMTAFGSTTFGYSGPDQNQRVQVNSTNYVYSGLGRDCESNAAGSTYYTHDNSGQLIDERTPRVPTTISSMD